MPENEKNTNTKPKVIQQYRSKGSIAISGRLRGNCVNKPVNGGNEKQYWNVVKNIAAMALKGVREAGYIVFEDKTSTKSWVCCR